MAFLKRVFIYLLVLVALVGAQALFHHPRVPPVEWNDGDKVEVKVNRLTSVHTQLSYEYYSLPFCQEIDNSLYYEVRMGERKVCSVLCKRNYNAKDAARFVETVGNDTQVHWIVNNLPAVTPFSLQRANGEFTTVYVHGYPLGKKVAGPKGDEKKPLYLINNHINMKLLWHQNPDAYVGKRIVGFEVIPESIQHGDYKTDSSPSTCESNDAHPLELKVPADKDTLTIVWTYSVTWEEVPDIPRANRWDRHLLINTDHWFFMINSLMIALFLTGMMAIMMMRTLHADF